MARAGIICRTNVYVYNKVLLFNLKKLDPKSTSIFCKYLHGALAHLSWHVDARNLLTQVFKETKANIDSL
jgi:hypothetical protein